MLARIRGVLGSVGDHWPGRDRGPAMDREPVATT
jgi:hypothetical protein